MNEIRPNEWYSLYRVFGDNLFILDNPYYNREHTGIGDRLGQGLTRMFDESNLVAKFKDSQFSFSTVVQGFSLENLNQTEDGKPIFYPLGTPTYGDIRGLSELELPLFTDRSLVVGRHMCINFCIDPVLEEDLIGEKSVHSMYTDTNPLSLGRLLTDENDHYLMKDFRYRLLLRSEKGIFASNDKAMFNDGSYGGKEEEPSVFFIYWSQINSEEIGYLCLPIEFEKIAPLEIMLQEK